MYNLLIHKYIHIDAAMGNFPYRSLFMHSRFIMIVNWAYLIDPNEKLDPYLIAKSTVIKSAVNWFAST